MKSDLPGIPALAVLLLVLVADLPATESAASATLRLSLPLDYQVHQRATRDEGKIIVVGHLPPGIEGASTLETRLVGAGGHASWQKLIALWPSRTEFRSE